MAKPKKEPKNKLLLPLGIVSIMVLSILILLSLSYSPYRVSLIDNVVAQIPLIPKTPKQIITRTQKVSQNLNSYEIDFTLKVSAGSSNLIDLSGTGAIASVNQPDSRSESQIKGRSEYPQKIDFDFQTYSSGKNLFFKVSKAASVSGFDTTKLGNNWYEINLEEFQGNLGIDVRDDQEIINDINKTIDKFVAELFKSGQLAKASMQQDEENYKLSLEVSQNPLSDILFTDNQKVDLVLTVEKSSFYLNNISLKSQKDKNNLVSDLDYSIDKQNEDLDIKRPDQAKKIENPIDFYMILNPSAKDSVEGVFGAVSGQVGEAAANFLTIERINRVVLLLPKAL